jgi:hypothetical protein
MRLIYASAIALSLLTVPAFVSPASAASMKVCAANWKGMSAADKAKTTYKDYASKCLKGGAAAPASTAMMGPPAKPKPAAAAAMPGKAMAAGNTRAGATGQCNDGTYTMSKTHSGACSRHKGVAKWF